MIINAFWNALELAEKACFDGKSYSCFMYLLTLASIPNESVASINFFDLSNFCNASRIPGGYIL